MGVFRKWYCNCTGQPRELEYDSHLEEEASDPVCPKCGASPSSDPKHTISFMIRKSGMIDGYKLSALKRRFCEGRANVGSPAKA